MDKQSQDNDEFNSDPFLMIAVLFIYYLVMM